MKTRILLVAVVLLVLLMPFIVLAQDAPPLRLSIRDADELLPLGTRVWANLSDGIHVRCNDLTFPGIKAGLKSECFRSEGMDLETFAKGYITGYKVEDYPGGEKVLVYRVSWTSNAMPFTTFDNLYGIEKRRVLKLINVRDSRIIGWSEYVIDVNW